MSFAEDYVNAYRDGLVEVGEWHGMDKKEQAKALKSAVSRAQEVNGKMSAIIQMKKIQGCYVDQAKIREKFVANVLRHYRYETELPLEQARAIFSKELGLDS